MSSPERLVALVARMDAELAASSTADAPRHPLDGGHRHVLQFELGGQRYAVASSQLLELTQVPPITAVPGLPSLVKGLANFRGRIVTVLDPGTGAVAAARRMVVVRGVGDQPTGILVDASFGIAALFDAVTRRPADDLPATGPGGFAMSPFVTGVAEIDGEDVSLVDLAALVASAAEEKAL